MVQTPAVDLDSFPDLLARSPVVVLHIWAPWNGHDLTMDRMLQKLIPSFADRIEFRSRDVDLGLEGIIPREAIRSVCNVRRSFVSSEVDGWRR